MKVSIVTAFYCGNKYMEQYAGCIQENQKHLHSGDELEAILVNDSPQETVTLPVWAQELPIKIYNQEQNGGIHSARVRGLGEATGEYVMFLDQDDLLEKDAIAKHIARIQEWRSNLTGVNAGGASVLSTGLGDLIMNPVSVSNANLEQKDGSYLLWYRSRFHKDKVGDYKTYLKVGVQIISPGQCLIPKALVPKLWRTRICKQNGSDDYYLWLLLLARRIPFLLVDEPLYIHRYTGANLSADTRNTDASTYEFLEYLQQDTFVAKRDVELLRRMTRYKDEFRRGNPLKKITATLANPDIFLVNLIFKLRSKTPYGFNR